jgi:hypothetical protein
MLPCATAEELVRAYVLIETTTPDNVTRVETALGSLPNCKALVHSLWHSEVIAHLQCNDAASLNQVLTNVVPQMEGVARITTWVIVQGT